MDLFEHRYYRISKRLMTLIGQWPYQSTRVRRIIVAVIITIVIGQIIPEILAFVKYRNDRRIVLEDIIALLFVTVCASKLISLVFNSQKTFHLLNRIRTDWKVWAYHKEVNILHEYAEQGEIMIIMYTAAIYSTTFVFLTQPITPKVIDILLKNGTEPGKFPLPVDYYYFDEQKYYFYIIMYSSGCVFISVTLIVASDVMLITYVQHVCGFFAALGHKLERIGTNDTSVKKRESSYALHKRNMSDLAWCIDKHNDAIEYADLIEASYKWSFFFIIGLGMIMMMAIGLEVFLHTSNPEAGIRFVAYAGAAIFHFFIECYIAQILMDHGIGIHFYILSPKAQKLVQFLTMRCGRPCQLTAGGLLDMSMRTFGLTVRTGMSYFTIVRTIHV